MWLAVELLTAFPLLPRRFFLGKTVQARDFAELQVATPSITFYYHHRQLHQQREKLLIL